MWIAAVRDGSANLRQVILARDDLLALEMSTFLWEILVLDVNSGDAAAFEFTYRAKHVELVAVPGIRIGDHRHVDRRDQAPGIGDHLRHRDEAEIGVSQARRRSRPRHIDG